MLQERRKNFAALSNSTAAMREPTLGMELSWRCGAALRILYEK